MANEKAWVTLATNDTYSLGALVLAHSLKKAETSFKLVVLISSNVTHSMRGLLQGVYDEVIEVNLLDSGDVENLRLLARPELGVTFTKLHCWKLTQYEKCVFLDADTLVLQNCDDLFEREELSAAPDVGWPDCFNSGVFVFKPDQETYEKLINFALAHGSFDGGDQGLLNMFFSDWATSDSSKRLPFLFNLSSAAIYSYLPAFKWYGKGVKIVHFIGNSKPWLQPFNSITRLVQSDASISHLNNFVQYWWDIFCANVHPYLSPEMAGLAHSLSQMKLEEPTPEQLAQEDLRRRMNWEEGNIDYMGRDSFDNILNKISESLSQVEGIQATDNVFDGVSPATTPVSPTRITQTTAVSASPVSASAQPTQESPSSATVTPVDAPKTESSLAATQPKETESSPSSDSASLDPKETVTTETEVLVSQSLEETPVTASPVSQSQSESEAACAKPSPIEKQKSQSDKEADPKERVSPQSPSQKIEPSTEPENITSPPKSQESPTPVPDSSKGTSTTDTKSTATLGSATDTKSATSAVCSAPVEAKEAPTSVQAESTTTAQEPKNKQTPKSGGGKKK